MLRLSALGLVAGLPFVALTLLCCAEASAQTVSSPCKPTVTGQVDLVPLVSRVFHNQRFLRVWVPPGYSDPGNGDKRYPVLYVVDGNLLFGDCGYGMQNPDWGIDETLTALIAKGTVPPMIVVGIESVIREYELIPYRDPFFLQNSPEPIGRLFPEFLAQDIIPVITKRYPQVRTVIVAGAKHSVTASAQRFGDAMLFLFGR